MEGRRRGRFSEFRSIAGRIFRRNIHTRCSMNPRALRRAPSQAVTYATGGSPRARPRNGSRRRGPAVVGAPFASHRVRPYRRVRIHRPARQRAISAERVEIVITSRVIRERNFARGVVRIDLGFPRVYISPSRDRGP